MRKATGVVLFAFLLWCGCMAQSGPSDTEEPPKQAANATDTDPVPLAYPYAISTAPHFAVFVEFPRADSIRRIALGDIHRAHLQYRRRQRGGRVRQSGRGGALCDRHSA